MVVFWVVANILEEHKPPPSALKKNYAPQEHWQTGEMLHGATTQKTTTYTDNAMKISNPANF
jgi:hypothetical protein